MPIKKKLYTGLHKFYVLNYMPSPLIRVQFQTLYLRVLTFMVIRIELAPVSDTHTRVWVKCFFLLGL